MNIKDFDIDKIVEDLKVKTDRTYDVEHVNSDKIVKDLKGKTDRIYDVEANVNASKYAYNNKLSKYFYDFLSGKSNKLPKFKYIDAIRSKNGENDFIISVGCGLFAVYDGARLYVRYEEPLSNNIIKYEEFFSNKYDLRVQSVDGKPYNREVKSSFDKKRIIVFQNYLKQYSKYVKNHEVEDTKSKIK